MGGEDSFLGSVPQGLVSFKAGTLSDKAQEGAFPEEEGVGREQDVEERSLLAPQDHEPLGAGRRLAHERIP